jgi:hypothetical protein
MQNKLAPAIAALVFTALFPLSAAYAQGCVPGTASDWMTTSDPLAARARPVECSVVEQSPPDFGWPSTGGSYQLTITYPNGSTKSLTTSKNWVNWAEVLPAGTYKWQVSSNGTASRVREFTVSATATPFLVPSPSTVLSQVSATPHPRGLPSSTMLATMKSQRAGAVDALIKDVQSKQKESLPGTAGGDGKAYSRAALRALAAAVYSQQGSYYNEAIRRVMNLAAWDPNGATAYAKDVEGARAITWALAVGYDWLYTKLSASQRSQILAALKVRGADMYGSVMSSIERNPRDSYRSQSLIFIAVISALVAPDLADASTWLSSSLPLALNSVNPWAGDEGGFSNAHAQGIWDVGEQLMPWYVLRWATGIDVAKKAWVKNWARYIAYFSPIGSPSQVFGDGLEMNLGENSARFGKGYTYFAPTPLGRWYASKLTGESQIDPEYLMAPPSDYTTAAFPSGLPNSLVLPTIGQLAMHSDLSNPARTSVYFKSSPAPYGAFNHAHADQNSFVINSNGQRLAIESGYYDGYRTPHWTEWYKQTRAKNAITYDGGKGQVFYEQDGAVGSGKLTRHLQGSNYEIVTGDATQAYGGALTKAERSMVYLRPNLILVHDNLASQVGRQWEWNIHSLNAMNVVSGSKVSIENNGQTLCVDVLSGPPRRFEQTDRFTADPSGTRPRQWHGKFYSTELLTATEFVVLLNVGCTQATASATKTNGIWTVQVNENTVQISDAAISVNGTSTAPPATSTPAPVTGTPYSGTPVTVPALIEAENFDKGGEGVAYHDTTTGNGGGQYRAAEDVDIIASTDSLGGGYVINNFASGEWLTYSITVPTSGQYVLKLRASNNFASTSAFHVQVNGNRVTNSIPVPLTGSWNTFQWVATPAIPLTAGTHVLKVVADQQYFNLNSLSVEASSTTSAPSVASTPYTGTPIAVPVVFEAENYDKGGQGIAYHDTTAGNSGSIYRTAEDVDLVASPDSLGGGYVVNNFATGEWLAYTINVPTSGQYVVQLRSSNNYSSSSAFHLQIDGAKVTGSVPVPMTGSWSTYQWVAAPAITLSAGKHVLKVVADKEYFNLNSISIAAAETTSTTGGNGGSTSGARLIFSTGFEGSTALESPNNCFSTGCWQNLVGTDSVTGFSWPPSLGSLRFQMLVGTSVTASTVGNYITNQIQTVTGHKGTSTRAMYSVLKQKGGSYCCTQDTFVLQPTSEPGDLYISYWMKYQPNLIESLNNQWRMLFEWKTAGDYRVTARVVTYGGAAPYFIVIGDNEANGGLTYQRFWEIQNKTVPVPIGEWFKFEVFWHRSSGSDGRVWMAVNGRVIADRRGPNIGVNNKPINRIMMPNLYTGGVFPAYHWIDDIEIWNGFPPSNGNNPPYAAH